MAACRMLAKRADARFLRALHRRAKDEAFADERPALYRETLRALGAYASPSSRKVLESVIERRLETTPPVAIVGIKSYARIQERDVVDRLIRWLAWMEFIRASGSAREAERTRAEDVRRVVLGELRRITGENHGDAPVFRHWWRAHRAGFRF